VIEQTSLELKPSMVTLLGLIFRQIALCPLDLAEDVKIDQSESRVCSVHYCHGIHASARGCGWDGVLAKGYPERRLFFSLTGAGLG